MGMPTLTAVPLLCLIAPALMAESFDFHTDGMAVGATYETLASGDFRLGDQRFDWDHADRAALAFRTRVGPLQQVETVGGIDIYGDWRSGDTPAGTLEDRTFGFDLQCALALHLAKEPSQAAIDISAAPFLRAGIAWHQLSIKNVETDDVRVVDDADSARFAAAFGADLRLVVGRKFEAFAGGGMQFWTAGSMTVNGYSGSMPSNVSVTYSGQEVFLHLGVLLWLDR